jgi:CMP-N-acetylneuraminic acid synthetase
MNTLSERKCCLGGQIGVKEMPNMLRVEIDKSDDHRIVSATTESTDEPIILADNSQNFGLCYTIE